MCSPEWTGLWRARQGAWWLRLAIALATTTALSALLAEINRALQGSPLDWEPMERNAPT